MNYYIKPESLISISDLRAHSQEALLTVEENGSAYLVNHNKVEAVILSKKAYNDLISKLEDADDEALGQEILNQLDGNSMKDLVSLEEVAKTYNVSLSDSSK